MKESCDSDLSKIFSFLIVFPILYKPKFGTGKHSTVLTMLHINYILLLADLLYK